MSDDEDYYEDDLDGEWYWFEEADVGVADELAEAATYSPIPVEDPSLDAVEVFSDWEYYSDDYYDDDLSILRRQGRVKDVLQEAENLNIADGMPPRKKRKFFTATDDLPTLPMSTNLPDHIMDAATFKGVVWKSTDYTNKKPSLYEPGNGETVALFKNWREVFKNSHFRTTDNWLRHNSNQFHRKAPMETDALRIRKRNGVKAITNNTLDDEYADDENVYQPMDEEEQDILDYDLGSPLEREFSPPPSTISEIGRSLSSDRLTANFRSSKPAPSRLREVVQDSEGSLEDDDIARPSQNDADRIGVVVEDSEGDRTNQNVQEILHVAVPPLSDVVTPDSKKRKREEPQTLNEDNEHKRTASGTRGRGRGRGRPKNDDHQSTTASPSSNTSPNDPTNERSKRAASPIPTRQSKRTRKSVT